ncbi:MAG: hypothetical protein J0G33_04880 [Afipia felis]|nr:hypothetical protein [Afipia felis]
MRLSTVVCSALILGVTASPLASSLVMAQAAKAPAKSPLVGGEVRYFTGLGDILGDLPVDAFIRETHDGGKITSTVLDVCYSPSIGSERKDRFAVELKADGQKLSGTGQTTEEKLPVTVNLTRKPENKAITFEGKITVGDKTSEVLSTDNTDSDQREFEAAQSADDSITESPADFTELSPQSLALKVKRENFADLLKSLRNDDVELSLDSLATDCTALRTGTQLVRFDVDPQRAGALVARLKTAPGVVTAGWTTGSYDTERAIRIPAADWRKDGKLDRDRLAAALAASASKTLAAQAASTKWSDTTGELTITMKRPNTLVPSLNLTDTLEVSALVGPEKPGNADRLVIWLGVPAATTRDEATGPHLNFADSSVGDETEGTYTDDDGLVRGMATDLKGQRWDAEQAAWK